MSNDIVGLEVGGDDVTLKKFAAAVSRLKTVINSLSSEIAGSGAHIDWVVESLESGSALQRFRGVARRVEDEPHVPRIAAAFQEITKAYERGERPDSSQRVLDSVERLIALIDDETPYLKFETANDDAYVDRSVEKSGVSMATGHLRGYGAVEGRIQTLTSRGSLRFTLYDRVFDKAVSCYLSEDQRGMMASIWGRLALVEGIVTRHPQTGRPFSIRQISAIELLPEVNEDAYLQAEGVSPPQSQLSPEDAIRRGRDVG